MASVASRVHRNLVLYLFLFMYEEQIYPRSTSAVKLKERESKVPYPERISCRKQCWRNKKRVRRVRIREREKKRGGGGEGERGREERKEVIHLHTPSGGVGDLGKNRRIERGGRREG